MPAPTDVPARVLITLPDLTLAGGVANYYRVLRPYLDPAKEYFEVGARPGERGFAIGFRLLQDCWRFHRRLRRGQLDLVHLNPSLGPKALVRDGLLLLIAKAHGYRVLVFLRGWAPEVELALRRRYAGLFRRVYGRADAFVVLAAAFGDTLEALGCTQPVFLETTVIPEELLALPLPADRAGPPDSPFRLLFLSRLDAGKGLPETLAGFARLRERVADAELVVAGEGPARAPAEAQVRERGIAGVRFAGYLDGAAKQEAFAGADAFVLPSAAEGMPNAVLEAMAAGLPVVTRAVGGLQDFFEDGRMGYLVAEALPDELAARFETLARDRELRRAIGQRNRAYASEHFAPARVATRLLQVYARVIGHG